MKLAYERLYLICRQVLRVKIFVIQSDMRGTTVKQLGQHRYITQQGNYLQNTVVTIRTTRYVLCMLPTLRIYVLRTLIITNSGHFNIQHSVAGLHDTDELCSLRGGNTV